MSYLGSWNIDDNLTFPANTHDPSSGQAAPADLEPGYRIYEDMGATPVATGVMSLHDVGLTVAYYQAQVALTAANGFEVGKSYSVYIEATMGGVFITTSHTFQIGAAVRPAPGSITGAAHDGTTAVAQTGNNYPIVQALDGRVPAALVSGRMDSNASAIADNSGAAGNLAAGANELYPFTVGAGVTTTSIPTGITGAPYTDPDHFAGRVCNVNRAMRKILASGGSPVVLTTTAFPTAPSQNDPGVIS